MRPIKSVMTPDAFYRQLGSVGSGDQVPPVEKWDPALSGEMDLVIKKDGSWVHEGRTITRPGLVRTFSRILKRENDEYFLVTPGEKWRIQVETAPFLVTAMTLENPGKSQVIKMTTNTDNLIHLSIDHPLWVEYDDNQNPTPYILVRHNLNALINRNVYNELTEIAECVTTAHKTLWQVRSSEVLYLLGEINEGNESNNS